MKNIYRKSRHHVGHVHAEVHHRQDPRERGDFLIKRKANQPSLRYGMEDRLKRYAPVYSYTDGPELGHGRIETRTYRVFGDIDIIADKEKWGVNMTVIEYESDTVKKSSGARTTEKRLYVSSLPTDIPGVGFAGVQSLVDRKHALDTGLQSAARQDKTQVGKSRQKP